MSLIKFPSHITPSRLTVRLLRVDETVFSPITNIQQVIARGNPVWIWTYEYTDVSDDEREIVQAFLLKCKGSLNTFKVTDPGDYEIRGSISDWIDVYSGYGSFNVVAGSDDVNAGGSENKVNSWFSRAGTIKSHITEEQIVRFEWHRATSNLNLSWFGHGDIGRINSLEIGKAYIHRIKTFHDQPSRTHLFVGSDSGSTSYLQRPLNIRSSDSISSPFITPVNTVYATVRMNATNVTIGNIFEQADYRLARCALVANSENLLTRSNEFDHADWFASNIVVVSGFGDASPTGITSGAWHLFGNLNVNTTHVLNQIITKITSEDIYTYCKYCKKKELSKVRLQIDDNGGVNASLVIFDLDAKTVGPVTDEGVNIRGTAQIWDVGSNWLRCQLTVVVSSLNQINGLTYLVNDAGSTQFTNSNSDGIEIFGGQLTKFPFMKHYVPTIANTVVPGSGQTGSSLYVDGLDPENIIKSGQRFEIVNQFYNNNDSLYERTEFKRITKEIKTHREGSAILYFNPPIRNAPTTMRSDRSNDHLGETIHNPIIFHQPEMKARLVAGTIQYVDKPLKQMDIVFDIIEDMTE